MGKVAEQCLPGRGYGARQGTLGAWGRGAGQSGGQRPRVVARQGRAGGGDARVRRESRGKHAGVRGVRRSPGARPARRAQSRSAGPAVGRAWGGFLEGRGQGLGAAPGRGQHQTRCCGSRRSRGRFSVGQVFATARTTRRVSLTLTGCRLLTLGVLKLRVTLGSRRTCITPGGRRVDPGGR